MTTALAALTGKLSCSVPGCGKPHIAKTFCQNHYRVFKRRGTPIPPTVERKTHTAKGGYKFQTFNGKTTYLHVVAAELAIGKPLPIGAEVHHINGDPSDNRNENLIVCNDHEYHMLIHQRQRAIDACGNANARPCRICGRHDTTDNMNPHRHQFYHKACLAAQSKARRHAIKEKQQ